MYLSNIQNNIIVIYINIENHIFIRKYIIVQNKRETKNVRKKSDQLN